MITITNPKGVDVPIQLLQTILDSELWPTATVEVYGRVFEFEQSDQMKAVVYTSGNDYLEVLQDDNKDATVFFHLMSDVTIESGQHSCQVGIVFSVNLEKLYPLGGGYRTEYVEADALKIIENSPFIAESIVKGSEAFQPFTVESERVSMYPFYAFRVVTRVSYLPETC